jgi:hypothetical protein
MEKLLHCPCTNEQYCGTMVQSTKLHKIMYDAAFKEFIHSRKGLQHLLKHYDGKTTLVEAMHKAYNDLK